MRHSQFRLLSRRRFAPLFTAQFFGVFNDNLFKNALVAVLTYRIADERGFSDGDVTMLLQLASALIMLPFALISPTAGQIADGMDKARMIRRVKVLEIVLILFGAAALYLENLTAMFALVFLLGAQSALFAPIKYGVMPQYLKDDELLSGNGLVQSATFVGILAGQLLGALLARADTGVFGVALGDWSWTFDLSWMMVWDRGTALVAALAVGASLIGWAASLFCPPAPPLGPAPRPDYVLPRATWRVVRDVARLKVAFAAMLAISWFWFVGAAYLALLPVFAKSALGGDEGVYTVLLATFSVGVALGALLCHSLYGDRARIAFAPLGAIGIAVFSVLLYFGVQAYLAAWPLLEDAPLIGAATFVSHPQAWLVIGALLGLAACAGLYLTPLMTVMQTSSPPNERARVIAASNVIDAITIVLAAPVNIALAAIGLSTPEIYVVVGLTGAPAAFIVWRMARRLDASADAHSGD